MKPVALLICGALGKEVKTIVDEHGWDVDIYGVPAMHHFYPKKIVEAVDRRLGELSTRYRRVVVVYGDCGTAGSLDPVLDRHGAVRLPGPHCYEMFAGAAEFDRLCDEQPATFFLTDWLVRNFERAVIRGLGLDRYPDLKPVYFQNYTHCIYLAQLPNEGLRAKADEIAAYLELPLEVRSVGFGELESRLTSLVEEAA
ncbi:MAG: DUF1638 domain-containing protein [Chloroflexi bacterium]|nr:MAG: DUF1638 domain-containing protein [Chloroflexota bacterium]TME45018.1 MAG: DUF1638 domain-containing protein [Chloroflexota bacterium]